MQLPQETILKCMIESPTFQKSQEQAIPADIGDGEPLPENLVLMFHKTCFENFTNYSTLYSDGRCGIFTLGLFSYN